MNPPAFPSHGSMGEVVQEGMSLRDYFVAHAPQVEIQSLIPNTVGESKLWLGLTEEYDYDKHHILELAKARGIWADAMLSERLKGENK